jgi:hypothetical protein
MSDSRNLKLRGTSEPEITWTHVPRVEPGIYPAMSRSAKVYRDGTFQRWVCAVQFDVLEGDLVGVQARLTWFLNMGAGEKPHAGRRGHFWCAWVIANGATPQRRDRLSPRVFLGRQAQVLVGDTTKDFKQVRIESNNAYSVVRNVTRWESVFRRPMISTLPSIAMSFR